MVSVIDNVSHTFRETNKIADALSNEGCVIGYSLIYTQESKLPKVSRGEIQVNRLGFPSLRKCKR